MCTSVILLVVKVSERKPFHGKRLDCNHAKCIRNLCVASMAGREVAKNYDPLESQLAR